MIALIHKPEAKSRLHRAIEMLVTLLMWALWLWMFSPLLATVQWGMSDQVNAAWLFFAEHDPARIRDIVEMLELVVAGVFVSIPLWVGINILRFRNRERRQQLPPIDHQAGLAAFHQMDDALLRSLGDEKELVWPPDVGHASDIDAWLKDRQSGGRQSGASVAADAAVDPSTELAEPVEPSLRKTIWLVVAAIMSVALLILMIRLLEGMPITFRL